ncbi:MAG: MFS transporter [Turneriella sp.]
MRGNAAFFVSCLLAFTGGHMVNYSVIIYAQEVLRSDLLAGLGFGLCFSPPLLLGWYAGVLCDRLRPVYIIHFAQGAFIIAAGLLAIGHLTVEQAQDRAAFVLTAAFFAGVGWSFVAPARMTTLAQISLPADLKRASLVFNLLVMLGFGLGPLAISLCRRLSGWPAVFAMAAILFVSGSLLLIGVQTRATHIQHKSVLEEISEGLRSVRGNALVAELLLMAIFCFMLMGPMQVLLPRLATKELSFSELGRGAFLGTLAPSLIIGGLLCLFIISRVPNGKTVFAASLFSGLLFALLSIAAQPWAAVLLLAAVGILGGVAVSLIVAGLQTHAEERVRGRVLSMYTIITQVVPAASGLAAGVLSHTSGVRQAILICGCILAAFAVVNFGWMRTLRAYRGH